MEYRKSCTCKSTATAGQVNIGSHYQGNLQMVNAVRPKCDQCRKPWQVVKDYNGSKPIEDEEGE